MIDPWGDGSCGEAGGGDGPKARKFLQLLRPFDRGKFAFVVCIVKGILARVQLGEFHAPFENGLGDMSMNDCGIRAEGQFVGVTAGAA